MIPLPAQGEQSRSSVVWAASEVLGVAVCTAAICFYIARKLGQDASWDLRNYHFYNVYAWLHGRRGFDIAPAMRQTWFNPLLDLPAYWLITHVSPMRATLALAAWQGLLLVLMYVLARRLLREVVPRRGWAIMVGLGVAAVGFLSPLNIMQLGATSGDNTSGVLVLAAVVLAAWPITRRDCASVAADATRHVLGWDAACYAAAGLLAGAAFGLKLTNGPFAAAIPLAMLSVPGVALRTKLAGLAAYCVAAAVGAWATGGFWWWTLYEAYGNPLFPNFNHIFRSPELPPLAYNDDVFRPRGVLDAVAFPLVYHRFTGVRIGHAWFEDVRIPLVLLLCVPAAGVAMATGWARAWRGERREGGGATPAWRGHAWLLMFVAISYVLWLVAFSVPRYLVVLEVLAPLAVVGSLVVLGVPRRGVLVSGAVLVLAMAATYHTAHGSRRSFAGGFFDLEVPQPERFEGALVVIEGHSPVAYAVPSFPASTRFVRVQGNLFYGIAPEDRYAHALGRRIGNRIDAHRGPMYALMTVDDPTDDLSGLRHFGLRPDLQQPVFITGKLHPNLVLYPLKREARSDGSDD